MTKSIRIIPQGVTEAVKDGLDRTIKTLAYSLGQHDTLGNAGLEEGDLLPDDATYHIIKSDLVHTKDGAGQLARVVAVKYKTE